MAEKRVSVRLGAEVRQYQARMAAASRSTRQMGREAVRTANTTDRNLRRALDVTGKAALGFGAAVGVGFGLAAAAAVRFEAAFAGVQKTVEATPMQLAEVRAGIRDLSKELPASANEIAGVAQVAGQLGVAADDIVGFSRVVIDMGESTDMAGEQAAFALSRVAKIINLPLAEARNLGSAIVGLGNNFAATESEITDFALRIAGAGDIAGITAGEIVGIGTAMAAVGIQAQAGGTSVQKVLIQMSTAVANGTDELETFAQTAGMSADEFGRAFEEDAAAAFTAFVEGLGRQGVSATETLEELNLTDQRLIRSFLTLAGAGDTLREALSLGNREFEEGTALTEEAERRYATTGAQLEILRNHVVDLAVELGDGLLPAIQFVASAAGDWVDAFQALPGPVKTMVASSVALAGVLATVGGAFLLLAPRIRAARAALAGLAAQAPTTAAALRTVGVAGGAATAGITAVFTAWASGRGEIQRARSDGEALAEGLLAGGAAASKAAAELSDLGAHAESTWANLLDGIQVWEGVHGSTLEAEERIKSTRDTLIEYAEAVVRSGESTKEQVDSALNLIGVLESGADLLGGKTTAALNRYRQALDETAGPQGRVNRLQAEYQEMIRRGTQDTEAGRRKANALAAAQEELASEQEMVNAAMEGGAGAVAALGDEASGAASDVDALSQSLDELFGAQVALDQATVGYRDELQGLVDTLHENGATLDGTSEAGRRNLEALSAQTEAARDLAQATFEQTGSSEAAAAVLLDHAHNLRQVMQQAGFAEEMIQRYLGRLNLLPAQIVTALDLDVSAGMAKLTAFANAVNTVVDQIGRAFVQVRPGVVVAEEPGRGMRNPGRGPVMPHISVPSVPNVGGAAPRPSAIGGGGGGGGGGRGGGGGGGPEGLTEERLHEIYNELLQRDADPSAVQAFVGQAESAVREAIRASEEFAQLQARIEQRRREDIKFELGEISPERMRGILEQRLSEFEKWSNEWVETRRQLQQVEEQIEREREEAAQRRLQRQRQRQDTLFEIGEIGTQQYLGILRERLAGTRKFSQEWLSIHNQIEAIEQERVEQRRERQDVLFEVDRISTNKYLKILRQRLRGTEQFSREWLSIHQQITRIQEEEARKREEAARKAEEAEQARLDRRRERQDVRFRLGRISTDRFLEILQGRLDAADQFSQEWLDIRRQMETVRGMAAIEEGRTIGDLPSFQHGGVTDWPEHETRVAALHGQEVIFNQDQLRALRHMMPPVVMPSGGARGGDGGGDVTQHFYELPSPRIRDLLVEAQWYRQTRGRR